MFSEPITPQLRKAMREFEDRFDDAVPLEMIGGTTEELLANIQKCLDANRNLLSEQYGLKVDGNRVY